MVLVAGVAWLALGVAARGIEPDSGAAGPAMHPDSGSLVRRSLVHYTTPDVDLVRDDGRHVRLTAELDDGRPVIMNFIYTSCTTICPLSSQVFELFQKRLGPERDQVHLVSISLDPEQDTPGQLKKYARQFHAGREWQHYTGSVQASLATQRAYGVYRGDKMNHIPVTLLRKSPGGPWIRLDGFATAEDLFAEYHNLIAAR